MELLETLEPSLSLHLLKHHPDILRTYISDGKIIVNSSGIFIIRGGDARKELVEYVTLHMEWVVV